MSILIAEEVSQGCARRGGRAPRLCLWLVVAALCHPACAARVESSQVSRAELKAPAATPAAPEVKTETKEVSIGDSLVREDELTYKGYTVEKLYKTVREAEVPGGRAGVAYAVLERRGKVLLSFDAGVYDGGLNSIGFGLFPLLGGTEKQLIVSQDAPREGQQWIVSLSPSPHVIYDGPAFGAGREIDDLQVSDLDGDGVQEIVMPICHFYGFRDWALAPAEAPLPPAVFKYDAKAGKYLPANGRFRAHLLKGLEEKRSKVRGPEAREAHLADVLSILLDYVYAGEEREAWEFYEATYGLPDKAQLKREVKRSLRAEPVYRFMYGKRAAG